MLYGDLFVGDDCEAWPQYNNRRDTVVWQLATVNNKKTVTEDYSVHAS